MQSISTSAIQALPFLPDPHPLQRDRVSRRASVSAAVAGRIAELAFGEPREPLAWVWPVSTASAGAVRL